MGVIMLVAGRVLHLFHVIHVLIRLLGSAAGYEALPLLGYHVRYESLAGLEIIAHRIGLIRSRTLLEHRLAYRISNRVGRTHGIHRIVVQVNLDLGGIQLQVIIGHLCIAVHECTVAPYKDKGIRRRERYGMV